MFGNSSFFDEEAILSIVNDPNTLDYYVRVHNAVRWAGFAMVFAFNIAHLILFFIDIVRGFKYSNR